MCRRWRRYWNREAHRAVVDRGRLIEHRCIRTGEDQPYGGTTLANAGKLPCRGVERNQRDRRNRKLTYNAGRREYPDVVGRVLQVNRDGRERGGTGFVGLISVDELAWGGTVFAKPAGAVPGA